MISNKMNYEETIDYLFNIAPMFQNIGADAYKEGLSNTLALDQHFYYPHRGYHTIHVAGTNGKGSTSHTIASILQQAGYRVGLYTSPHLVDFRERIRVNGQMISKQYVIDFVAKGRAFFEPMAPSFFELTTALALNYFYDQQIDIAVIEVGMGGRLDCTNIINPKLSIITNISYDHTQFLGDTLEKIAYEKAGIIKPQTPVVIGESQGEVRQVFLNKAKELSAPIHFADEGNEILQVTRTVDGFWEYNTSLIGQLQGALAGSCQPKNTATILCATRRLRELGFEIGDEDIRKGFNMVCEVTGLMGRWQKIQTEPTIVCDIAHNPAGLAYVGKQLSTYNADDLHIVIGMVSDKDITHSLSLLPPHANYYFTQAHVQRAMPAEKLTEIAQQLGFKGNQYTSVAEAVKAAQKTATTTSFIFIGGSTFVVADYLLEHQSTPQ